MSADSGLSDVGEVDDVIALLPSSVSWDGIYQVSLINAIPTNAELQ